MGLDWDVSNCRDWKEMQADPTERAITEAIVWATMSVGINEIEAYTVSEFYHRCRLYDSLYGERMYTGIEDKDWKYHSVPKPISMEDLKRRIGMRTNASELTTYRFFQKLRQAFDREEEKWSQNIQKEVREESAMRELLDKQGCEGCKFVNEEERKKSKPCCMFGHTCTSPLKFDKDGKCLMRETE